MHLRVSLISTRCCPVLTEWMEDTLPTNYCKAGQQTTIIKEMNELVLALDWSQLISLVATVYLCDYVMVHARRFHFASLFHETLLNLSLKLHDREFHQFMLPREKH